MNLSLRIIVIGVGLIPAFAVTGFVWAFYRAFLMQLENKYELELLEAAKALSIGEYTHE